MEVDVGILPSRLAKAALVWCSWTISNPVFLCSAATILLQMRCSRCRSIPGVKTETATLRKISDTIARLSALHMQRSVQALDHGKQDRLKVLTDFGSNPGALKGKFYLPIDLPENAPLVVVLHGCTQNASAYDHHSGWSRLADDAGFALLFPEQQRTNNPNLCFNWFEPGDTRRNSGEALSIWQMIEAMVLTHGIDRQRIFVTGLSAGGAMAGTMLATYPEVFAGGAIIAGLPYGSAATVPEAFDRMRGHGGPSAQDLQRLLHRASDHRGPWPKISIWQGTADYTVAPSNAEAIALQWQDVHRLKNTPARSETTGAHARQVWCDASGEAVVEIRMIAGMGHGTPVGDGLGTPGPYMLDIGISSTREIARFWGIDAMQISDSTPSKPIVAATEVPSPSMPSPAAEKKMARLPAPSDGGLSTPRLETDRRGVRTIIEDALRAAGLMR